MGSKAVNRPVKPEDRDKDINQKLQLFGIYSAFAKGKVPSNKQIDIALNSLLESKALKSPPENLSKDTFQAVDDARGVIAAARNLILVKNEGNLIQEFIWEVEKLQKPEQTSGGLSSGFNKDEEKQRGAKAAQGLKTLGTLLITNGQFRKLLSDATVLLREMASDSAQKAVGRIKPSEEQMAQIDKPAEEGVWHEKPNFNKDDLKSQVKSYRKKDKGDTEATEGKAAQGTTATGTTATGTTATGTTPATNGTEGEKQTENKRKEVADKTKAFLAEKVPKERREQTIWRLKKMIVEIQGHADYQEAVETLLSLAEDYAKRSRDMTKEGKGKMKGAREETGTKSLETKLRTLIERFANGTSSEDLFDAIKKIAEDANNDSRLRGWFSDVNNFIRKCLREQGYVLLETSTEEWKRIYDEGRYLFRERYREHANGVLGEFRFLGKQFDEDPLNKEFAKSLEKLFHNVGYDEGGNLAFKSQLLKDSTGVIIPGIIENLHYVPIPRIEVSDPMIDLVIENLAIETDNLMPNVLELGSDNYWRWGRKKIAGKRDNKVMISASGIQTDWKGVNYYVKKKSGFPRVSDQGVMDLFMGGEGFSFRVTGSSSVDGGKKHFINPEKVSVDVKNLDIKFRESKHKFLFALVRPFILRSVRPIVKKVLEKQIHDYFVYADSFALDVDKEAHRTRDLARNDPEDKRNIYAHYSSALRQKLTEKKEKDKKAAENKPKRDTKVNIAMTTEDSILKDVVFKSGGISTKSSEYKDLAAKGDKWESPVFSIGKAKETTGLPKLAAITRKPHDIGSLSSKSQAKSERDSNLNGPSSSDAAAAAKFIDGSQTIPGTGAPV